MSRCVISNLPFLDKLSKLPPKERKKMIETANLKLIQSIVECIENVLNGNVVLEKQTVSKLKKHKSILRKIKNAGRKLAEKKKVIIQSGGAFLPALLTPIIGLLINKLINQ